MSDGRQLPDRLGELALNCPRRIKSFKLARPVMKRSSIHVITEQLALYNLVRVQGVGNVYAFIEPAATAYRPFKNL